MDVTIQANRVSSKFTKTAGNTFQVYDKVIIGGGMSGLSSALEILLAAEKAGKDSCAAGRKRHANGFRPAQQTGTCRHQKQRDRSR